MSGDFPPIAMMLNAELVRGDIVNGRWDVINEIVISRSDVRPIEVRVDLNELFGTYKADGLIVSTATDLPPTLFLLVFPYYRPSCATCSFCRSHRISFDCGVVLAGRCQGDT